MPVRFNAPGLGGTTGPLLRHQWEISLSYRYLTANRWYVGTEVNEGAAPFGKPLFINIHSVDVTIKYALSDRVTLTTTLPFSTGTHSRFYGDGKRHEVGAAGLGDITAVTSAWLWNPRKHESGNLAVSVGLKTPTGDNEATDNFFLPGGLVTRNVVDQSIQLGDGGWGFIAQAEGFRKLLNRSSTNVSASYLFSPKDKTGVKSPYPGVSLSVPDVYSARAGVAYAILPKHNLYASLGLRADGIPIRDLIGDSNGFRRPGYSLFIDPGFGIGLGRGIFSFNIPVRIHQDFERSLVDRELGKLGGGDLAKYLVFASYSIRF